LKAGDAFQLVGVADKHLWIVISDPAADPSRVLFVNFTTYGPLEDQTVILGPTDHSFIQHKTCVAYSRCREANGADLEKLRQSGRLQLYDPVSPELLQRLRQGAADSPRAKIGHVQLLRDQGLIE
jgi:hypothetical protein